MWFHFAHASNLSLVRTQPRHISLQHSFSIIGIVCEYVQDMAFASPTSLASLAPSATSAASSLAPLIITSIVTTEVATSVVILTPSATRSGETPTPIAVTSVFTLDSLPLSCSSRWVAYISSGSTIITSGNYAGTLATGSVSSDHWQSCYPNAPRNPLHSPGMCTGQTSVNTMKSAIEDTGSTAATIWSEICCPRHVYLLAHIGTR